MILPSQGHFTYQNDVEAAAQWVVGALALIYD